MSTTSLEDLKEAAEDAGVVEAVEEIAPPEPKIDEFGRSYATGKRKTAVARVWIKPGSGKITVNKKDHADYFGRAVLQMIIKQPLVAAERLNQFDVICTVSGSGPSGQAGAVRHGISKALTYYEPGLRPVLKKGGFLTRDSRVVERKNMAAPKRAGASSSRNARTGGNSKDKNPAICGVFS